ncbi:MAG: hypothetical protein CMJ46_08665, partial [Planctomyces sp.]|nr:hypothetical protein [Planctomyces sp.]
MLRSVIPLMMGCLIACSGAQDANAQSVEPRYTPPALSANQLSAARPAPTTARATSPGTLQYTPRGVNPGQRIPPGNASLISNAAPGLDNGFGHSLPKAMPPNQTSATFFNGGPVHTDSAPITAPNPRHAPLTPVVPPAPVHPGLIVPTQALAPYPVATSTDEKEKHSTELTEGTFTEYKAHMPRHDENARPTTFDSRVFVDDPNYSSVPFMPNLDQSPYTGKYLVPTQRPWLEFGRGLYRYGPIPESSTLFGETNLMAPSFLLYGDYRAGAGYIKNGNDQAVVAHRLNLDFDLKLTDTERFHAFWGPLDRNVNFSRVQFEDTEFEYIDEFDYNFDTFFFEGDIGSMYGGLVGEDAPFDMPIAIGFLPLLYQNGIWMEDAFLGAAVTIPAQNNRYLDWVNYDVTFFAGFNDISSPAFVGSGDGQTHLYGATAMIDAYNGYIEAGYAFLDDRTGRGLSYHNMALGYSRRIQDIVSTAVRVIVNTGQDPINGVNTADGQMLLWENAFITSQPLTFVPYLNFFVGFDRTQSVARAAGTGGILRNTGINFETDGLTGYPTLDATGANTYGGAVGVNWLGKD